MRQMRFREIVTCACRHHGELILEDLEGTLLLSLQIGCGTTLLLAHELDPRPCAHAHVSIYHLPQMILLELGGELIQAVIDASEQKKPVGILVIRRDSREVGLKCDAADTIALAVQAKAPIYVTSRALHLGGRPLESPLHGELDVQGWLEKLKPEDFSPSQEGDGEL